MKTRVENDLYLVRNSDGAVVNTDASGYAAIMANKRRRIAALQSMSQELMELRNIVNALLEERSKLNGTDNS
jgi:hypothetical protein